MSATATAPEPLAQTPAVAGLVLVTHSPEAIDHSPMEISEEHRWLRMLCPPLALSAAAFAAAVATGQQWLIGAALLLGPMVIIIGFIYLGLTSDTNGVE